MNKITLLSLVLIISGFAMFFLSAISGNGGMALFIIFPVFYSTGWLGALGFLLIFFGFVLLFIAPFFAPSNYAMPVETERYVVNKEATEKKVEKHYGGVILIGPIPIVFGSDKNYALLSTLGAILMLIAIAFVFFLIYG